MEDATTHTDRVSKAASESVRKKNPKKKGFLSIFDRLEVLGVRSWQNV
jgi:hypothetical protein